MRFLKLIISILLVSISNSAMTQNKSELFVEMAGIYATPGELMPLYQYSNNWGVVSPFQKSAFWMHVGGHYQIIDKDQIQIKAGLSGIIKNDIDESILHQAFIRGKAFKIFDFSVGKEAYTPISYNDTLTVGGFLNNSNARPIPKVMLGIYEYLPLGFTKNWVEIRGGISHGWLNDDRTAEGNVNSADMPYLHEKWAYMRLGNTKIQPYAGLVHNSIMGGTRPNGDEIPIDYLATFFANGSDKIGGAEATNAAGAHEGFWDFGFYVNTKFANLLVYLQRPFADGSGLKTWEFRNHDFRIGSIMELKNCKYIDKVAFEFIKTDHQAGAGFPDPIYPSGDENAGKIIFVGELDDHDKFMLDVFKKTTHGWTSKDVFIYLEETQNHGYSYGGRNEYNNNGTYNNGWTYHKQSFGMPLYHTKHQTSIFAPSWDTNERFVFKNNRLKAIHLGIQGQVVPSLNYLFKYTFSKNYGSFSEEYLQRYSWVKKDNFLYENGKNQSYTDLDLVYSPKKMNNLSVNSSFSFDFGELYHSFGFTIGLKYSVKSKQ